MHVLGVCIGLVDVEQRQSLPRARGLAHHMPRALERGAGGALTGMFDFPPLEGAAFGIAAGSPLSLFDAIGPRDPGPSLPAPRLAAPADWPGSDTLADWRLGAAMDRGGAVVRDHAHPGEAAARRRLTEFLEFRLAAYPRDRDRPDRPGGGHPTRHTTC